MTIQEAYNKGLDIAENEALEKLTNAVEGNDIGPFASPKMEELRQKILNLKPELLPTNYVLGTLLGDSTTFQDLTDLDKKVIEILKYIRSLVGPKPRSRISVKIKQLLTELEVDIIRNSDKLN